MSQRSAIILTGKNVQDHEFTYPFYRLLEEGYHVDVATRGKETVFGIIGSKIEPTIDVPEIKNMDYDLLVIPGGAKAMEYMRQDQEMLDIVKDFHDRGKVIGSICHAAQMLISARIVEGKKISAYYSLKDDVNNAKAEYVDAPAVIDSKIVTSPHYKHLGPWMKAIISQVEANQ
jgi:protease I